MHLPDGFIDARTAAVAGAAAAAGIALAVRQTRSLEPRRVPMLGLAAAFVFAAQMLNFPVAGGTSGHLIGGVLTAVLLGPASAVLVITCVLIVQCLMFADGGLLALGANVFNMGIVSTCGGYVAFRLAKSLVRANELRATVFAAAFAGWAGTVLASISCAGQLALSGTAPWSLAFPAMANIHMVIGLGEGLATGLIALAVLRARPQFREPGVAAPGSAPGNLMAYGFLICLGLVLFVAPFASPWPDGLERVATLLGFEDRAREHFLAAPAPEYQPTWIQSATTGTAVAGLIGTAVVFASAYTLARALVPALGSSKKDGSPGE